MHLKLIDTDKFSDSLRKRGIDSAARRILLTRFEGSEQEEDISLPSNCGGFGRLHRFNRYQGKDWPLNPLPIDPAVHMLGLPYVDTLQAQVFQNAICSWRCWYCYVDFDLLSANRSHSDFKHVDDLIDCYLAENDSPPLVDLSGGQPDLVPEWILWFADALHRRGLSSRVYLWSDDNLSNDYLWRYLSSSEIDRLSSYSNYGRVGCFKGFDSSSFSFNTRAEPELFDRQFKLMRRLVDAQFNVFGYATFTADSANNLSRKMSEFVDRLQGEVDPNFPLRLVPLKIVGYSPTARRMSEVTQKAMDIQFDAVSAWNEEISRRFSSQDRSQRIHQVRLGA